MEDAAKSSVENAVTTKPKSYNINRYKPRDIGTVDDPIPDYMNLLAMVFSMCGLLLKIKWCAWCAVLCALVSFANSRTTEDSKQVLSSFTLSVSAVVMSYLQNPAPMNTPW